MFQNIQNSVNRTKNHINATQTKHSENADNNTCELQIKHNAK